MFLVSIMAAPPTIGFSAKAMPAVKAKAAVAPKNTDFIFRLLIARWANPAAYFSNDGAQAKVSNCAKFF
jgi:hypothetical protein